MITLLRKSEYLFYSSKLTNNHNNIKNTWYIIHIVMNTKKINLLHNPTSIELNDFSSTGDFYTFGSASHRVVTCCHYRNYYYYYYSIIIIIYVFLQVFAAIKLYNELHFVTIHIYINIYIYIYIYIYIIFYIFIK